MLLRLVPVLAKARDRAVVVLAGKVHRVVHVDAAAAAGEPDLRPPETDARAVARHHPDRLALHPALDDRKAEHLRVEPLGRGEVDDLEHELADTGDGNPGHAVHHSDDRGVFASFGVVRIVLLVKLAFV